MRFTDIFVRRPVLATALNLVILLLGLRAWMGMTVEEYPQVTSTLVTVTTAYPGADPHTVQGFVTSPLEQSVASAPGIDYMTSSSAEGTSTITVYMKLNYDPNAAVAQILAKVQQVQNQLPTGTQPPVINETVGDTTALMYLAFYSKTLNQQQVNDYVLRVAQPKIQGEPGVGQAQIVPAGTGPSGNSFVLRAWLDPNKLAAYKLTPAEVSAALASNNYVSAVGQTKSQYITRAITAETSLDDPAQFSRMVVANRGGTLVRLQDVARVELGAENYDQSVFYNGTPAVFIGVFPTPGANSLTVAQGVHQAYAELTHSLPPAIQAAIPYDGSTYIQKSIHEVMVTIAITLAVVVAVIFLFLGSLRSLLIPAVAIPLSVTGAGVLMIAMGYSINLLTLLAVVLAIGLVVDDAIIVVENIHRHVEEGTPPLRAALMSARELAAPIIVMATTLAAVFAPIGLTGGLTGSLFSQFAFTLVFTVAVSAVVALTFSPMISSKVLRHSKPRGLAHALDVQFNRLRQAYDRSLSAVLTARSAVLVVVAGVLIAIPVMFLAVPGELAPIEDQGLILAAVTAPATATLGYLNKYSVQLRRMFDSFPETKQVFQINGLSLTGGGGNSAVEGIKLADWSERSRTQMELLPPVQAKLNQVTGVQAAAFEKPTLPGSPTGFPVQFVLTSTSSYDRINQVANSFIGTAMQSGLFAFMTKDLQFDNPQVAVDIDRNMAGAMGMSMADISQNLGALLSGNYVNRFDLNGRSYEVIPQVPDRYRADPSLLGRYYVNNSSGALLPLSTLISTHTSVQPEFLPQFQQLNSATVEGVMAPGVTLGQALSYLKTESAAKLPSGFSFDYAGQSRQYIQQGNTFLVTFMLAIILVYLLLAMQFESFRDPLIVMVTVPMAISGALLFMYFGAATLNIYTEVGIVALIGLITKQGILIVQFANVIQETEGLDRRAAVEKASSIRLRPILMTTGAMVFGAVPLILATGPGSVSRFDMGLVIAAGLAIGALFSLYVVPVIYVYLATVKERRAQPAGESDKAPDDGPHGAPEPNR
ncbi:MAG TPA: efflux RND transporter permease subunit [Steroidobacteraceae bacterium]|nr:efflux RND transporter permease subunit [Steroidobacteraceae bacterium]